MIKINLAKKRKSTGGGGIDYKNFKMDDLTSTITNIFKKGDVGESKFDLNGPIPRAILVLVICWVLDDVLSGHKTATLSQLDAQIELLEKDKKASEAVLAKVKGFEPLKKQLEADELMIRTKLEVIAKLLENRNAPSKMLMQIAQSIPEEVWLTDLVVADSLVKINGATPGYNQVSDFIKSLNSTTYFSDITLKGIKEATSASKDQKVQMFELNAKLRLN
jgi:Tfp pilus assembly protein PilN